MLPRWQKVFIRGLGLVVVIGDGVADEKELRIRMMLDRFQSSVMTGGPPGFAETIRRVGCPVGSILGVENRGAEKDKGNRGDCKSGARKMGRDSARIHHGVILEDAREISSAGRTMQRRHRELGYGPTPPVWQSAQLTLVRSPMSTGCWKAGTAVFATLVAPSVSDMSVWHWLQSLLMTFPSALTCWPSWQRKQPLK